MVEDLSRLQKKINEETDIISKYKVLEESLNTIKEELENSRIKISKILDELDKSFKIDNKIVGANLLEPIDDKMREEINHIKNISLPEVKKAIKEHNVKKDSYLNMLREEREL